MWGCGDMEVGAPRGLQSPSLWGFSIPIPLGFLCPHPFGVSPSPSLWGFSIPIPLGFWSLHPQGDTGTGAPHTLGSDVPREHGAVQCHPPGSVPSPTTSAPMSPRWHRGLTCCAVGWAMGAAAVSGARTRGLCELCWVSSGLFWVGAELLCHPFNPRPFWGRKESFIFLSVRCENDGRSFGVLWGRPSPTQSGVGTHPTAPPHSCAVLGPHEGTDPIGDPRGR